MKVVAEKSYLDTRYFLSDNTIRIRSFSRDILEIKWLFLLLE